MQNALETHVPTDLRKVLIASPKVEVRWNDLTPIARRDFVSWIESAKQEETRKRRVERVPDMLAKGKRRPCCYAIVPMNLYRALGANPKAKVQWKDLTPHERRDFVSWVGEAKESGMQKIRIEKTCSMLTAGKRRP